MNNYEQNLEKNKANYVPLTPITFLERTKDIYPDYEAIFIRKESTHGNNFTREQLSSPVH